MCIRLIYYFIPCGHVESEGWSCRNKIYNLFCDSPFVEQEAVHGESCTRCAIKTRRRHAVVEEAKQHTIIDLDNDDATEHEAARLLAEMGKETENSDEAAAEKLLVEMNGKKGQQEKITHAFKVSRLKSGGEK